MFEIKIENKIENCAMRSNKALKNILTKRSKLTKILESRSVYTTQIHAKSLQKYSGGLS